MSIYRYKSKIKYQRRSLMRHKTLSPKGCFGFIKKANRWIRCNLFNKHFWCWYGTQDTYGNQCLNCNRVKYRTHDKKLIIKMRKAIHDSLF